VHQHVVVGRLAFLAAGAMVERDVPPFCRAAGDRASLVGLNLVGLQRAQAPAGSLVALRAAYRALFRAELPLQEALTRARASATDAYVLALLASVEASLAGQRQLCRPRVGAAGDEGP
jgi:UDP-N-acetylglucosamine acyltransferase